MSRIFPFLGASALAIGAALSAPPALADVKQGVDAWSQGDYDGAVRTWAPLAEAGDPDAQFNLAQAYKLGRGVPMDLSRAEALYGQAAAKGHTQAADAYGLLLFQRGERTKALPYIQAAASRGDPRAQYILAVGHFNGDIVPKDWVRAYALASLAREAGLPQADGALAQMDKFVPLSDRQKSVVLAQQLAAQTQANRQRLNTSAALNPQLASSEDTPIQPAAVISTPTAKEPAKLRPAASSVPPRASAKPAAPPVAKPAKPATGPWRLQLGAFGVAGNAEALWNRVKNRPELVGHSRLLAPTGRLTRLLATGFASKPAADAACTRMTAAGFSCMATRD